ncbi:hypothetical protein [Pyrobaculum ferrireducens]|uniref:Uncharacterized protein n=1 Tax=Pyrobaculum ferrireducens TaxID=1104324 RepID=G7VGI9_9CREN|nr:hypothetical protein [Pyrobaculum ferrireducens]AET33089.1 hypothetical protein P186_1675 [Pyrobaculum ferrireducens]
MTRVVYIVYLLAALGYALSIAAAPGAVVKIENRTTLTVTTDLILTVEVNNTKLSQLYGGDVFTTAVVNYELWCSAKMNKSVVYLLQKPIDAVTLSFSQISMDICQGEVTKIAKLYIYLVVLTRDGRYVASFHIDVAKLAAEAGIKLEFTPEWRAVVFTIDTRLVDRCNWLEYDIRGKYGGDVGVLKIISWDCFNSSRALRISYQPTYFYLSKYIKVNLYITIDNRTLARDLSTGGEFILPGREGLYGVVKNMTIEIYGPQNRYFLKPLDTIGPVNITQPTTSQRQITGIVINATYIPPFYFMEILLNDTVAPEGLYIYQGNVTPRLLYAYAVVKKPNLLHIYVIPEREGYLSGNFTITYSGPGVVKTGSIPVPPIQLGAGEVVKSWPEPRAKFYQIGIKQPQPLISVDIPLEGGAVAAYVEVNATVRPRDPLYPSMLYIAAYVNKSGVLLPMPRGVLLNSTNPGIYSAYLNGTVRLRWLIPAPSGGSLTVYIYGDNIATFQLLSGRAYLLTPRWSQRTLSPPADWDRVVAAALATAAAAALLVFKRRR